MRYTIIKKSTNNKCWRECGEKGTLLCCWWECKFVRLLWQTVCRFLKRLKIELPYDPANLKRYIHLNVHCSSSIFKPVLFDITILTNTRHHVGLFSSSSQLWKASNIITLVLQMRNLKQGDYNKVLIRWMTKAGTWTKQSVSLHSSRNHYVILQAFKTTFMTSIIW